MKGAEQLAKRGRPLAPRGSGRASGETRARGQRAPSQPAVCRPRRRRGHRLRRSPRCKRAQLRTMPLPVSPLQSSLFSHLIPIPTPDALRALERIHTLSFCFSPVWPDRITLHIQTLQAQQLVAFLPTRISIFRGRGLKHLRPHSPYA